MGSNATPELADAVRAARKSARHESSRVVVRSPQPDSTEPTPSRRFAASRRRWRMDAFAAALIALAVAVIGGRGLKTGGLGWSDAPNHFFDGVFVYEFLRDRPLDDPSAWAERFYLHQPAIGIVVYWPPGFAMFEAAAFALFGTKLIVARVLVLVFAWGASVLIYRLGAEFIGRARAFAAALLLVTCPAGEQWMTDVMLEWPATFWILLACVAYLRTAGRRGSVLCGLAILAAYMTKQTAGFILPVILIHAICSRSGRMWLRRPATMAGLVVCVGAIGVYSMLARPYSQLAGKLTAIDVDMFWYAMRLPEIVGWPFVVLCVVAVVGAFARTAARRRADDTHDDRIETSSGVVSLAVLWFAAWYGFSSLIVAKEPRYFFFALPPLAFLVACGLDSTSHAFQSLALRLLQTEPRPSGSGGRNALRAGRFASVMPRRATSGVNEIAELNLTAESNADRSLTVAARMGMSHRRASAAVIALTAAFIVAQTTMTLAASRGRLPSYAPAVDLLAARGDADLVLVDAVRDGQFVYDVHQHATARKRIIPLRASKLLYARAARMKYDGRVLVESESDIVALLHRYGIRYIVLESKAPASNDASIDPLPRKLLRTLIADDSRFAKLGAWPLRCDDPDWSDVDLCVYEYLDCPPRTTRTLTIPIPAMGRDIEIDVPQ